MKNKKLILIAIAAVLLVAVVLTIVLITSNSNKGEAGDEEKYTVTFESNADGVISMPQKQIIEKGNYVTAPSTPSKEGYEFFGWSINSDTEAWTFNPIDFSTYPINSDTVFYAIWYSSELDVDSDGLSHADEQLQNTDAFQYDTDSDGLSDGEEVNIYYSDPTKNDTDGDGITDGVEIALCLNPLKTHSDGISHDTNRTMEAEYHNIDNSFELTINANAALLSSVSLQTVDTDSISNPIGLISPVIEIQYDKTNSFDSAKLVFNYSNSDLTGISEDNLTFLFINEETNQYEEIPSFVDKENKRIIAEPTHFSAYVVGDKNAVTTVVNYNPLGIYITVNEETIMVNEVVTTNFDVKYHGFAFKNFDAYCSTNGVCYGFSWVACLNYLEKLPFFGLSSLRKGKIVPSYNLHNDSRYANNRLYIESEKDIFNKSNNWTWYSDNQEANAIAETLKCIVNIWDKQPLLSDQFGQNLNKSDHFQKLIDNLKNDIPVPLTLIGYKKIKWQPDMRVGHSVLAYGLYQEFTPNEIVYYILVYDCNYPGQKRYITAKQNLSLYNTTYTLSYGIYDNIHISDPIDVTDDESLFIKHKIPDKDTTITPETTAPEPETTEHVHQYNVTEKASTCTAEGSIVSTCSCGDSKTEILNIIDHNFVSDKCTMCGLENVVSSVGLEIKKGFSSCEVVGIGTCADTVIVIPETYEGLPVTSIARDAFENLNNIKSIYIPKTIKSIGNFGLSKNLNPFENCSSLEKIVVSPENTVFKSIDNCLIHIQDKVLVAGCNNSIIPSDGSVTSIGNSAFVGCTGLTSINIPGTIEKIGSNVFDGCKSLTEVTIESGITIISSCMFYNCSAIKNIVLPEGITHIGINAFAYCTSLEEIIIPDSVESIQDQAFLGCSSLKKAVLGKNVINIDMAAFLNCDSLQYNTFNIGYYLGTKDNPYYVLIDTKAFAKDQFEIHKDTKVIGSDAFDNYILPQIKIPEGVIALSDGSIYGGWSTITEIILPDSLIYLGYNSLPKKTLPNLKYNIFENGKYLGSISNPYLVFIEPISNDIESVTIHNNTKFILSEAFKDFTSLKKVTLGKNCTVVENSMFNGCSALEEIIFNGTIKEIGSYAFSGCSSLKSIALTDKITHIGDYAFEKCTSITSIFLPESIEYLGAGAFSECSSLVSATLPDHITDIPNNLFAKCTSLSELKSNENLTSIGTNAFNNCVSLTSFTFKNTLKRIGDSAFNSCKGLKKLEFYGTNEEWEAVIKSNYWMLGCDYSLKVTIIEPTVLDHGSSEGLVYTKSKDGLSYLVSSIGKCTDTDIVISGTCNGLPVTAIDNYAFEGCNIVSITIPSPVKTIASAAFKDCTALKNINLPKSMEQIGFLAFQGCTALEEIYIPANTILGNAFVGCTSLKAINIDPANTKIRMKDNCLLYTDLEKEVEDALILILGSGELPNDGSIKMILSNAFYESDIKEIVIPEGVTLIDVDSFTNCYNLEKITLPESLIKMGGGIFNNCSSLKEIYIPKNVNAIKANPFSNCPLLKSIKVDPANTTYRSVDNCIIDIANKTLVAACSTSIIPNDGSVTVIGIKAFANNDDIKFIELNNHITKIDDFAFYKCTGLEKLVIPDSVTTVDSSIIFNCEALIELVIGDGITNLDGFDIYSCKNLKKLKLGSGITVIEKYDLSSCYASEIILSKSIKKIEASAMTYNDNITAIRYEGTIAEWNAIEKEEGWDTGSDNYTVYCTDGEIKK